MRGARECNEKGIKLTHEGARHRSARCLGDGGGAVPHGPAEQQDGRVHLLAVQKRVCVCVLGHACEDEEAELGQALGMFVWAVWVMAKARVRAEQKRRGGGDATSKSNRAAPAPGRRRM